MYKHYPSIVFGFHACDQNVAEKLINGPREFKPSENDYDWLGSGMYFWENSLHRAERFAETLVDRGQISDPCVIGAAINLGHCLDLVDSGSLSLLRSAYDALRDTLKAAGCELDLQNNDVDGSGDVLKRELDCAIINFLHSQQDDDEGLIPFDSVRGVFWEGDELYPGSAFKDKNHIQLCIRNPNCIKGYFWPLEEQTDCPVV